jgi:hypothetical protein
MSTAGFGGSRATAQRPRHVATASRRGLTAEERPGDGRESPHHC